MLISYKECSRKEDCAHEPVLIEEATGDDASLANFVSPAKMKILKIKYQCEGRCESKISFGDSRNAK